MRNWERPPRFSPLTDRCEPSCAQRREVDFIELLSDADAAYDETEEIDLSTIEPLIALPSSPGNVVPVREIAGRPVEQVVIGSSANPGLRDFAIVAAITKGPQSYPGLSFDVNPSTRQILQDLTKMGATFDLIGAGARLHQSGCMGCIGMGQAPANGRISLRTMPRNFPGRSGPGRTRSTCARRRRRRRPYSPE